MSRTRTLAALLVMVLAALAAARAEDVAFEPVVSDG